MKSIIGLVIILLFSSSCRNAEYTENSRFSFNTEYSCYISGKIENEDILQIKDVVENNNDIEFKTIMRIDVLSNQRADVDVGTIRGQGQTVEMIKMDNKWKVVTFETFW